MNGPNGWMTMMLKNIVNVSVINVSVVKHFIVTHHVMTLIIQDATSVAKK
jgi:hypothetical protein